MAKNLQKYLAICPSTYFSLFWTLYASMGFFLYSNQNCQFKILPEAFSEQTAKYNVLQYFCFYGNMFYCTVVWEKFTIKIFALIMWHDEN